MRLDKFVSQTANITRTQAKKVIAQKRVKVDSLLINQSKFKLSLDSIVEFDGQLLSLACKRYILLYKPTGYICSSKNEVYPSALNLVLEPPFKDLHFAGRLDVDTTGLVLISDDGQWTHRVTSPKKQCKKIYRIITAANIDQNQVDQLTQGVELKGEDKITLQSEVEMINSKEMLLTIYEGRYHQVKRMLAVVGNHVEALHREQIGEIKLDGLKQGEWRDLSIDEKDLF